MVLGNDEVEFLLGILGGGRQFLGYVGKDCDLLGWFNGDRNERAIGAEELVYLFTHRASINL